MFWISGVKKRKVWIAKNFFVFHDPTSQRLTKISKTYIKVKDEQLLTPTRLSGTWDSLHFGTRLLFFLLLPLITKKWLDCSRTVMYRRELHPPPPPTIIQSLDKGLGSLQDWLTSLASRGVPIRFALSTVHTVQHAHCLAYSTNCIIEVQY